MLYDKRWDKTEVKSKPEKLSLAGLIAWLETQDASTPYNYRAIDDCLLTRYFKAQGFRWVYSGVSKFSYSLFFLPPLFTKSYPYEMDQVAVSRPHTYGAALERAREISLASC